MPVASVCLQVWLLALALARADSPEQVRDDWYKARSPEIARLVRSRQLSPERARAILIAAVAARAERDARAPASPGNTSLLALSVRDLLEAEALPLADRCLVLAEEGEDVRHQRAALELALEITSGVAGASIAQVRRSATELVIERFADDPETIGAFLFRHLSPVANGAAAQGAADLAPLLIPSSPPAVQAAARYYTSIHPAVWQQQHGELTPAARDAALAQLSELERDHGGERHFSGLTYQQLAAVDRAALSAVSRAAIAAPPRMQPVRDTILRGVHAGEAPSVAVAVIESGRVTWAEGFGLADLETVQPATADTIYILASISKPLTASGLMLLVDRGLIDLDQPANRYLSASKLIAHQGSADEMTVRRLLNHTSGLPIHHNFFFGVEPPAMDETIRRYGFAAARPGSRWEYSNLGFGILEYLTACVAKQPWREFMEQNLYDPLGMSRTSDRVRPGHEREAAALYTRTERGEMIRIAPYAFDHTGASAIRTSCLDLARFALMHLGGGELDRVRVLQEASARAMQTESTGPLRAGYGLGFNVGFEAGRPSFSHGGGMPGVRTALTVFPRERAAYVILTNSDTGGLFDLLQRLVPDALFLGAAPASPVAVASPGVPPPAGSGVVTGRWRGRLAHFRGDLPLELDVIDPRTVTATLGQFTASLTNIAVDRDRLTGTLQGAPLETQPSFRGTPTLLFQLQCEGDRLLGVCSANAGGYFHLPHWVELARR